MKPAFDKPLTTDEGPVRRGYMRSRSGPLRLELLGAVALLALAGCGCGLHYHPALHDTNIPAPVPLDPATRGSYVAAEVSRGKGFNKGERTMMGRGHYMVADGDGMFRWSYGGFIYGGRYTIQPRLNDLLRGPRDFGGAGVAGDLSFSYPVGGVTIGGGVCAMVGLELGPYALLWGMRGTLPYVGVAGAYAAVTLPIGAESRLALQGGLGMPGLGVLNGQLELDRVVIWGGYGMELDRYPAPGRFGRIGLGMAYRVE